MQRALSPSLSLLSLAQVVAAISRSPVLASYRRHEKLIARLPGYRVKMGFGLHSGWAIEGAIGSEFKIDASYLSPNVNMASPRFRGSRSESMRLMRVRGGLV